MSVRYQVKVIKLNCDWDIERPFQDYKKALSYAKHQRNCDYSVVIDCYNNNSILFEKGNQELSYVIKNSKN